MSLKRLLLPAPTIELLRCMSPVVALPGPPAMSALAPLLGANRTSARELTVPIYEYTP